MNTHIFAAKQMVKQGFGGRIVGAGSIASYRTAENLGPYGATKFAVRGFTEAAAKEWAQYGIRVNGEYVVQLEPHKPLIRMIAYGPGIVDTPMWDHIDRELARIVRPTSSPCVQPLIPSSGGYLCWRRQGAASQA